jgi:hypothetical protein
MGSKPTSAIGAHVDGGAGLFGVESIGQSFHKLRCIGQTLIKTKEKKCIGIYSLHKRIYLYTVKYIFTECVYMTY